MPIRIMCCLLATLLTLLTPAAAASRENPNPVKSNTRKALSHCDILEEIYYLPEHRLLGDADQAKDHAVAMDLFIPKDAGPFPCIITVHGGGYGEGDKNSYHELTEAATKAGFVVVAFNYHLSPKGIFPQVFDDFRDCVRLLRARASEYKIDPLAIGACGFSAGGWLLGSSVWTNGDCLLPTDKTKQAIMLSSHIDGGSKQAKEGFLFPMGHSRSEYPEHYGLIQAVSMDFAHCGEAVLQLGEFPALNRWRTDGGEIEPEYAAAGILYSISELIDPASKGKTVHVPGLNSPTVSIHGGSCTLAERLVQFFHRALVSEARTPLPEVRPGYQVFQDRCEISFVTPSVDIAVHYSLDGSQPSEASTRFTKPFTITSDIVIKALAVMPNRQPSLVTVAHFYKKPDLGAPEIVAPAVFDLPEAAVGQPYMIQFEAVAAGKVVWQAAGELRSYTPRKAPKGEIYSPTGLFLDESTGILSGTPDKPGMYWVQVQAANSSSRLASLRNYRLRITGAGDGSGGKTKAVSEDNHVELCRVASDEAHATLLKELSKAGVETQIQEDGAELIFVVPEDQLRTAKGVVKEAVKAGLELVK